MVTIVPPLAIWAQLGNLCFLLAGLFSDILVVKGYLFCAYFWMTLYAILGGPLWPSIIHKGHLSVDGLVWGCMNLYVLSSGIIHLALDETSVTLTEEEDALWRMFYRLGGVSRKIFQWDVARRMKIKSYKKGEELPVDKFFHIVYKGSIQIEVMSKGQVLKTEKEGSGAMFDFSKLNLLHDFQKMHHQSIRVTVLSEEATFFEFSNEIIKEISQITSLKGVWQSVFLGNLARIVNNHYEELDGFSRITDTFVDPLFSPLQDFEQPDSALAGSAKALTVPILHLIRYTKQSLALPWPVGYHLIGLRHGGLPAPPRVTTNSCRDRRLSVPDVELPQGAADDGMKETAKEN